MNKEYEQTHIVAENETAKAYGSGNLDVYATPALVALMENTALNVVKDELEEGTDTVGIEINVKHLKASAVGEKITCKAVLTAVEGRKYSFNIEAKDEKGDAVGTATHDRFLINKEKFMSKIKK